MPKKYVCVHGHFYQPPRENPWLEMIEVQDSASPYHDWNERINRECYAPNTVSRILDAGGRLREIVNNFERISFNIGPTLFSWLEKHDPLTYGKILQADKKGLFKRGGHGPAIAQAYNHMIMPLASSLDKKTQIIWGAADFYHRFKRKPEGMWLPETAVDKETLSIMRKEGIKFTILSQRQAKAIREKKDIGWKDLGSGIDPSRAYEFDLEGNESIAVFFYDGPISQAVAFEGILSSADRFVERMKSGLSTSRMWPQLVHIATDGESYGHHHRFGDMTLAYAMNHFESSKDMALTNYGEFLSLHPPVMKADIHENSSWSCAHGVERWRSDCGCKIGSGANWNQKWREPLREGLNTLKTVLDDVFASEGEKLFKDPWEARNAYIDVILDRGKTDEFLMQNSRRTLSRDEKTKALKLMEIQRNGMLMFTSCGWFFDDVSGIETVQILKYAARAIQLCEDVSGVNRESEFLEILRDAHSNVPQHGDAEKIYQKYVKPDKATLGRVMANHVMAKAMNPEEPPSVGEAFAVEETGSASEEYGENALLLTSAKVSCALTMEDERFLTATLRLGGTDVTSFVKKDGDEMAFGAAANSLFSTWRHRPLTEVVRLLDSMFSAGETYMLKDLFVEQRRKTVSAIMAVHVRRFADTYKQLFRENKRMLDYFIDTGVPLPMELRMAAQYILEKETLLIATDIESQDALDKIGDIMGDIQKWGLEVNLSSVRRELEMKLQGSMERLIEKRDLPIATQITRILLALTQSGLNIDAWGLQNLYAGIAEQREKNPSDPFYGSSEIKKLGIILSFSVNEKKAGA